MYGRTAGYLLYSCVLMGPRSIWLCNAALLCGMLALLCAPLSSAQTATPDKYAGEPFVIERSDVVYAMNADGTGYMQKTVAVKIQSQSALQQLGIVGMGFAANSQHVELHYVRARRPDGSVTDTPVSGAMEQPIQATVQAPFYSDLKITQIPVKNLQLGDTLEWEARVVITKPEAPNQFWSAETFVTEGALVKEEAIELRVPASKPVTVWTNPALGVKPKESTDGDMKVYRWETAALSSDGGNRGRGRQTGEEEARADRARRKSWTKGRASFRRRRGRHFRAGRPVGEWYRALELSRATPDDEIKAKVAELTAGKDHPEKDKARAIYEYVSTQVRYIGVAFGVGRYQPHQAVDVLHNQYGDLQGQSDAAERHAGRSRHSLRRGADWSGSAVQRSRSLTCVLQSPDHAPEAEWAGCMAGFDRRGRAVPHDAGGAARPRGPGGAACGNANNCEDAQRSTV